MFKLKSIYKSIVKYPTSLVLNVLSLVIAFTGIITLMLYISYENSFDTFNKNYHSIYKIEIGKPGSTVPAVISPIIQRNIPEIGSITPLLFVNNTITTAELKARKTIFYTSGMYAKNDVFSIFTFPFILGKKEHALSKVNTAVLTESMAKKLFGTKDPVGKEVLINDKNFTVTGVIQDIPKNSSFHVDDVMSFKTITQKPTDAANTWQEWSYRVFCKVNKQADIQNVAHKLNAIKEIDKQINHVIAGKKEKRILLYLKPLSSLHFSNDYSFSTINKKVLNVLSILALVLALMGAVNFINLTTSQAFQKAKIFSIKRVFGANRTMVMLQVILEAILISLFALALSFLLHRLLFPYLQNILAINGFGFGHRIQWYLYFILMAVAFGIVAGIYPAYYISSPDLSQSVKGAQNFTGKGKLIRNSLLVLQFVFAITLIITSIGIGKQIRYWHDFNIGIQKENIIYLRTTRNIRQHYKAFAKELIKNHDIAQFTYSGSVPGNVGMGWGRVVDGQQISLKVWPVDKNFLDFFGLKIVKGRPFSKTTGADINTFIINQKAVEQFGWKKPLEKNIPGFNFNGNVIGVVKDFNFSSLKERIKPMMFWLTNGRKYYLLLKIKPGNYTQTIAYVKKTWQQFEPVQDFNFTFLDNSLNALYAKEDRISYFVEFVALWSILLSLTGLLGLVLFTARDRTKEIGIRKVNGASVLEIVKMLNREFLKWVAVAFVIAIPIAYYAMHKWLQNFAYKTALSWWIFALAGIIVLSVALITVSWHTFRVARRNPVEALRYE